MAFGPLARVAVQVLMTVGGAVGRAAMEAYKEAAAGRGAAGAAAQRIAGRRMSVDEARQVLDADVLDGQSKIQERFELLHKLNGPTEEFAGSPYLQLKIDAARSVLIDEIVKASKEQQAKGDKGSEKGSDKSE
mmetsp:Transcript_74742/g.189732  ORF Transcript_74742/g.189732 Transcript_74742/m.189732 type:complete len:133 (-) Transcript_74742:27-425(-)|eukprot:CAMPEP_0183389348 /NCGR_PEP_ID=MMETSP0370-20130417/4877_1 /TAXON_ID=268820 /ORGANISM="Peridinium aciculiferum, Strain PAER-2" /LENGTH=132 /DNA_ID=CAMNT_0025568585 /DNA_START=92 /DNA_END=490 /DNA_ORIENTATION=-